MFDDAEMVFRIECRWRGKRRTYQHALSRSDLDDILPFTPPMSPQDAVEQMQREDRRRRMIDMISGQIAHAMTNALLSKMDDTK